MRGLGWVGLAQGGPADDALPAVHSALAAHIASLSEHLSPSLLVRELPARPTAAALWGMTLAIEIFVYPEAWPVHLLRLRLAGEHRGQALHGLPLPSADHRLVDAVLRRQLRRRPVRPAAPPTPASP